MDRTNIAAARLSAARWWFALTALATAAGAGAQVTPVEPFGGRPFGADPSAPAPAPPGRAVQPQQGAPMVVQPGAAPVVVQPGAGPVMVQPQMQPQPQPPFQAQPQAPMQPPNTSAMGGRPTSSVNPQPPVQPPPQAQQPQQNTNPNDPSDGPQNASGPQRAMTAPASPVTPPFAGNRAPAPGGAAPSAAQSPVRGLPPDAPRLVISGAVYSPDPARRMLIVNGQVVREGADLGSGVMLQEVRPQSAVLDFRGNRYNVFF